jgi:hypothetical protein
MPEVPCVSSVSPSLSLGDDMMQEGILTRRADAVKADSDRRV